MFIYYSQEIKYKEDGSDNLDLSKVYQIVNLVSHFIPLAVWLTIVFFNQRSDHLISIIITLAVIILNVFLITSSLKYRILIQSNISYLVYLITLTMLIWGAYMFNDFPGTTSSIWVPILIYVLLAVILIISIIFIDDRVLADKYSKIIAVIIILSIAIIVKAGHKIIFTPINIFLLYALTLRIILFLISRSMIIIDEWIHAADNIPINTRIHLISRKTMTERVLVIICTFCFLFILFKRATMDQHDINVMEANNIRNSFREYVVNWLRADTTQAPIFLITGQGGGSRAGSVFFQTLSELDPILNNNLLSINTISGSGTGAQFYLSAKFSLGDKYPDVFKQTSNITKANKILYQQDYISSALFKILFTDYIRSKFIRHPSPSSRNYELMKLESDQYDHLVDSFNFKAQQMDSLKYLNSDWGKCIIPLK
ncbi:MAG: hypothetical protein IPL55_00135 [Saprospiraceae bacterium]|nr:hypothetical protein [Saprospiraceae bacterium]